MSCDPQWTVFCDADDGADDGCHHWHDPDAPTRTSRDARRAAKAAGWVRRDGADLCPFHAERSDR